MFLSTRTGALRFTFLVKIENLATSLAIFSKTEYWIYKFSAWQKFN